MSRRYRDELRDRGLLPDRRPGRSKAPPAPSPLVELRRAWRRATQAQRDEFMSEAGLVEADVEDLDENDVAELVEDVHDTGGPHEPA